ncbi:MAG: LysM peptidoglycan-binding domain-containing protein, partial [Gallionella sp.]|nr:LysM peptidoglycan-binding domain-containing protein [Gallionella sp.]
MVKGAEIKKHDIKNCGGRPVFFLLFSVFFLVTAGCGSTPRPAPVIDRAAVEPQKSVKLPAKTVREKDWRPKLYTVQKGDTLYSIALDHGLGYKDLLEWNGIDNPNVIKIGQQLKLSSPTQQTQVTATAAKPPANSNTDTLKIEPKALKLPYSEKTLAQLQQGSAATSPVPAADP